MKLNDLKPLHGKRVVEQYDYLKQQKERIMKGFVKTRAMKAVNFAHEFFTRSEHPSGDTLSTK